MYIDTHTHLYLKQFDEDRDEIIQKALNKNITKLFLPNVDIETIEPMLSLSEKYPKICFPLIGLHPSSVNENYEKDLQIIETYLEKNKFYGIGEIGIDLYWEKKYKNLQEKVFIRQIELAKKYNLPIIIHSRKAFNEIFNILDELNSPDLTGIFHCFGGNAQIAEKIINYGGFMLGIGGVVTYKNSNLPEVLKEINMKHIVLETDAPFLPPVPKRGKRNDSSYIIYIAEKIAEIKNISLDEVAEITTNNAMRVFGKKSEP